jgi:SulP family sulfate permease
MSEVGDRARLEIFCGTGGNPAPFPPITRDRARVREAKTEVAELHVVHPMLLVPQWLREYRMAWVRPDLVAGLTLAAYLLPAGIGDASLAGLPPEAGLYACLFAGLVFWLFCSSRHTAVTVTSALSLLIGASVGELAAGDPARHAALAACAALLMALIAMAAWLIRAGNAIGFFSETVLVGFKAGLALYLASTQLPKLFGVKGTHGDFWERSGHFIAHLGETHEISLLVGVIALSGLAAGKLWLKNRPVAFLVVVSGMLAARFLNLETHGVALLGQVPQGLPSLGMPLVSRHELNDLLPVALASFVLGAVETSAIGRMFGQKHGHRFDANQELLALSAANLLAGLGRGFPVSGGMSQSLVNESAGARTPLSGLVAAAFTLVVVLFASGLLRNLPQPVLAAIVLAAVMSLVDIHALQHIWRFSRAEFFVAIAALLGVLGSGPVNGVLLGAAISIVLLLRQAARPRVTELARVPGTTYFADRSRHPENERTPGVLVARCESALLYFNAEYVRERLEELLHARPEPVRLVVFFLGAVPKVDLAGAELLADLHSTFRARGVEFRLADAHGEVRDALRRIGFERDHGPLQSGQTVDAILSRWQASSVPSEEQGAPSS